MLVLTTRRVIFGIVLCASGLTVAALSAKGPPPRRLRYEVNAGTHASVTPVQLASWMLEGRRDFTVIDLRAPEAFEQGHIRSAVNCGHCHRTREEGRRALEGDSFVDLSKKLVLYTETGSERVELPKALAVNPRLVLLKGGFEAWKADILSPVPLASAGDDEAREQLKRREAMRAFFAGERAQSTQTAELPVAPIKRQDAHHPAAAREGC